ncbi:oxidoreductase [Candidatus Pantoea bituminis]|jgi:2,4-dienoyl-CoA reductase-like NADH-dependent reductase (Old Yellow Enzyme family)|uniref:oxidoreductase n=1 Tax=Candidatus Pantoea bituminis TaxID=2831036 RepID=UPI001C0600B3|nr:NADH:flavin oxidoreductase [Pantoea bituminis]
MTSLPLFQTGQINKLQLKNRLLVAPMTRISASECGVPGERMQKYYQRFARGGFGTIITEGIYIDDAWSQTYAFQSGLINAEQIAGWRAITESLHVAGSKVIAQIQHAGALSQGNIYRTETVAPSAIQPKGKQLEFYHGKGPYKLPHSLEEDEIQSIISAFANTASHAVNEAGFDGVEIHGANGYLLDQFFTSYTNQRRDCWGGDIAKRLSLSLEVIRAVRQKVGPDVVVGIRISQAKVNDFEHQWSEGETGAAQVFSLLAASGVDYVHITEHQAWQPAFKNGTLSLVELARKAAPDLVLIANGAVDDADKASRVMNLGADFIAIGKSALANPDWPLRVQRGESIDKFDRDLLAPFADVKESELS